MRYGNKVKTLDHGLFQSSGASFAEAEPCRQVYLLIRSADRVDSFPVSKLERARFLCFDITCGAC